MGSPHDLRETLDEGVVEYGGAIGIRRHGRTAGNRNGEAASATDPPSTRPISGFDAMTQKSRLMHIITRTMLALVLALAAFVAVPTGGTGTYPQAAAQSGWKPSPAPLRIPPGAASRTPTMRAMPAPREVQKPRVSPTPRLAPAPGTAVGSGINRPANQDWNCRASCGSQCQLVSCSGRSVTECTVARQQCRVSCTSRC